MIQLRDQLKLEKHFKAHEQKICELNIYEGIRKCEFAK